MNSSGGPLSITRAGPSSSGASSAQSRKARATSGPRSAGQAISPPRMIGTDRVQPELQCGDDAEVATAALARPEQVLVLGLVGADLVPVGGHQLDGQEVVAAESVLTFQPPGAAPEGQPGDTGRGDPAAGRRQSELLRGRVEPGPGAPAPDAGPSRSGVDLDGPHGPDVDDHPIVVGGLPGHRVPTRTHGDREVVARGTLEGLPDVRGGLAHRDDPRSLVDHRVEQLPLPVVPGLLRSDPRRHALPPSSIPRELTILRGGGR